MNDYSAIIKQIISNLLAKMGFETDIDIDATDQEDIMVNIQTDEAGFLIGQAGANLQALQHLARVLVNKKINLQLSDQTDAANKIMPPVQFIIDVNNYRKNRTDLLKELALNMASQALSEKSPLFLQPMSAYERRIIHVSLAGHDQIDTESTGQGEERRVVIKPKF